MVAGDMFTNPFHIDDLHVFDDDAWHNLLTHESSGLTVELLACAVRAASTEVIERVARSLPAGRRNPFWQAFAHPVSEAEQARAQHQALDTLFWELIYWCRPDEYELLTAGEQLHPTIFQQLAPDLRGKVVLDAGAGSGRATLSCLDAGAAQVYAIEPSPGLRRMLRRKLDNHPAGRRVVISHGRFDALPLADHSVEVALSCSAFTALPEQGGEPGLAELLRVTRPGGKIFVLWPRAADRGWLCEHGFHYVSLPASQTMAIHFRDLETAEHCARLFYGRKPAVIEHILSTRRPEIPFSLIGMNPPRDYCWREVTRYPFHTSKNFKSISSR